MKKLYSVKKKKLKDKKKDFVACAVCTYDHLVHNIINIETTEL